MNWLSNILMVCLIIMSVLFTTSILYLVSCGKLFKLFWHNVAGWHLPDHSKDHFRGINECSVCKICGKVIMKDSQGNWF